MGIGGLQPTILARSIFGNPVSDSTTTSSIEGGGTTGVSTTRLLKTHRKINRIIDKIHNSTIREDKYNNKRRLLIKRSNKDFGIKQEEEEDLTEVERGITITDNACIRRKEMISNNENLLLKNKWSLDRALLLYGTYEEYISTKQQQEHNYNEYTKEKEEIMYQI